MSTYYETTPDPASDQAKENKLVDLALTKLQQPYLTGLRLREDFEIQHAEDSNKKLVFNKIDSATGVVWVLSELEGWWTMPEVESLDLPRGWGDGSYDAKGRYANRVMTLVGSFLTQSPSQVSAARDELMKAISWMHEGAWLIVREKDSSISGTYDKAVWVRLSGTPQISNVNPRGRTNFSIGLKAVDPIKYELVDNNIGTYHTQTLTSTPASASNFYGNTKVPVIFEISGAVTASAASPAKIERRKTSNGTILQTLYVVESQGSSDTLYIDTYRREVLFNDQGYESGVGAARRRLSSLVDWIELDPDGNYLSWSGTGTCTMKYLSGWIG